MANRIQPRVASGRWRQSSLADIGLAVYTCPACRWGTFFEAGGKPERCAECGAAAQDVREENDGTVAVEVAGDRVGETPLE